MLQTLFSALVIGVLVIAGLIFLYKSGFFHLKVAGGNAAKVDFVSFFLKLGTIILFLLGCAFLAGALLAYVQGIVTQITILAVIGVICLVAAIICFVAHKGHTHQ